MKLFALFDSSFPLVLGFPPAKWQILVFDHVPYLPFHRKEKKNAEIQSKNWPEYCNVEYTEERHSESNPHCFDTLVPKFKLR
jgi:hypothetical protein